MILYSYEFFFAEWIYKSQFKTEIIKFQNISKLKYFFHDSLFYDYDIFLKKSVILQVPTDDVKSMTYIMLRMSKSLYFSLIMHIINKLIK